MQLSGHPAWHLHFANGFGFANPNGGWEYPALWTAALLAQALLGNGAHAIDSAALRTGRVTLLTPA